MSVLERTGEIGVMRAMGMSRPRALGLFLVESVFIGLLGSFFGVLLGSAGAWYLQTYGVTLGEDVVAKMGSSFPMKATVYADLSLSTVAMAVLLGVEQSDRENFRSVLQDNFAAIFPNADTTSDQAVSAIVALLQQDADLSKYVAA